MLTSTITAAADPSGLQTTWFLLVSILWIGYFVLEGFDFGVGMLIKKIGRTESEKRAVIHTIGPVWDANEVWVLTAGGATFAAFPETYATLFSGFYLALFVILFALIVRGVSFEFWGKSDSPAWRSVWEWAMILGSALPALLWGVAWANIVGGVPLKQAGGKIEYAGTLLDLLTPYALLGGVVTLLLFLTHGAVFLTLRTKGEIHVRAERAAKVLAPAMVVALLAFAVWTVVRQDGFQVVSVLALAGAVIAAIVAIWRIGGHEGQAFAATAGAIVLLFAGLFADLFPNAIVGRGDSPSLSLAAASSTPYTLKVMTIVAVIFVPVVLAYKAWTYWVFRARLGAEDFEGIKTPIDLLERRHKRNQRGDDGESEPKLT